MVSMNKTDSSFIFIGNDRAVDFVNTRIMDKGACVDLLTEPLMLRDWFARVNLPIDGKIDDTGYRTALELRDAMADLFSAFRQNVAPSSKVMVIINTHLTSYPTQQCLKYDLQAGYRLTNVDKGNNLSKALATLAHDAAMLVVETRQSALKACSADDCVLIFKDTSKGQKRRWCSMDICGNRAKVSTHYHKVTDSRRTK